MPRAHRRLRRAASSGSASSRSSAARSLCGVAGGGRSRASAREFADHPAGAAAPRRRRPAPPRRADRLPHDRLLPALIGAWRHRGGGCSYIPTATAAAVFERPLIGRRPAAGPVRTINMSQLGDALTDPALDPPVAALVVLELESRRRSRPTRSRCSRACAARTSSRSSLEQFMTDTARARRRVLPATTQLEHLDVVFSWGHHYMTLNEPAIAPLGEAQPNTEIFRLLAARLGLDDPCFSRDRRGAARGAARRRARRRRAGASCASAASPRSTSARAPAPHAEGGFGRRPAAEPRCAPTLDDAGFDPPAEAARRRARRRASRSR